MNPPTPHETTHARVPGAGRRQHARGRTLLPLVALATTAALLTACSGPGGVDLGTDWKGASAFVLADVDGLVTVVGVDADRARAESLAVVPQQADDDRAVSPQIVGLADGRWLVTVPRKGGKPDRRYLVDRADHTLDGLRGDERLRRVLPGRTLLAEVAGLPDTRSASGAAQSTVLVRDPADWSTRREVRVPGTVGLAASDPASDTVCLSSGSGAGTGITVVRLTDGRVTVVPVPAGLDVTELACPSGHPVVVGSPAAGASGGARVSVTRSAAATAVSVAGGRADAVAATGTSIVVAVAAGTGTDLVEVDAGTGGEVHRVRLGGLAEARGLTRTPAGWLVHGEDSVTRVNLGTGATERFDLPGTLLDA